MSPARSRATALAAFVGGRGKGGNADVKSTSKSGKNKNKNKNGKKEQEPEVVLEKGESEGGKALVRSKSKSKACAPFRPANGVEGGVVATAVTLWEAQDTAVAVAVAVAATVAAHLSESKDGVAAAPVGQGVKPKTSKERVEKEREEKAKDEVKEEFDDVGQRSLGARDVRAYEHERQRVKRAEERAARVVRKEREAAAAARGEVGGGGKGAKSWEVAVDGEYVVGLGGGPIKQKRNEEEAGLGAGGNGGVGRGKEEVLLSDLVVYSAGRKKGGEEEFEFVPAVRAVIVLDEGEFGMSGKRDMEVDDWECVDAELKEGGGLSYAQVVLGLHID